MTATHQNINDLADFVVTPNNRVNLAVAGLFGQIGTELIQRFAAIRTRLKGTRCFTRFRAATCDRAVLWTHRILGGAICNVVEIISQIVRLYTRKCRGNRQQDVFEVWRLKHAQDDVTCAHLI